MDACFVEMMQAITVKLFLGEMHFNVAMQRPFLQHYRTKGKEVNSVENKRRYWRECRENKARCMYFAFSVHASRQQRKLRTRSNKSVYEI